MNYQNDDLRIKEINELLPPVALLEKFPATETAAKTVSHCSAAHKSRNFVTKLWIAMNDPSLTVTSKQLTH